MSALASLRLGSPVWRNRDFLKLWGAETVSHFGSDVSQLAVPLTAILVLDAGAFQVAALGAAITLPWLLISLPAGAWIDRLPRRPILVMADWGRAVLLASIPVAYVFDVLTLGQLYAVGFLTGTLTVFFDVSYQSYVPSLVTREQLTDANGKLEVSRTAAQTGGPALGGGLVSLLTAPYAILADAISFVASGLLISGIRCEEPAPDPNVDRRRLRTEITEGLRFVFRHPILRSSIYFVVVSNFSTSLIFAIYLVFAVRELDLSPAIIGVVGTLGNVGLLTGALVAPRLSSRLGVGPVMVGVAAASGWSLLLLPLARGDLTIPLLAAGWIGFGFCAVVYNVAGISLMQAITPNRMLGRMTASRRFIVFGINPLGMLVGGTLGTNVGLRETLWIGATGASLAFLPLLLSPIPRIKDVADAEELVETDPLLADPPTPTPTPGTDVS